jgi:hypothetical protein
MRNNNRAKRPARPTAIIHDKTPEHSKKKPQGKEKAPFHFAIISIA